MKKFYSFFKENFYYFIIYAFIGWLYELVFFFIRDGKLINRGFLYGTYLPIYGFGALILLYMLKDFVKKKRYIFKLNITPVLVFIIIFVVTTIVEYIGHFILDEFFGIVLWDYSKDFLNINGRVCFYASRNFAIGGTFCIYLLQPRFEKLYKKMKEKTKTILILTIGLIFFVDLLVTILGKL